MTRPYKRVSHNRIFGLENSIVPQHVAALIITCMSTTILIKKPMLYHLRHVKFNFISTSSRSFHFEHYFLLKGKKWQQNINENPYQALALFISLYSPIIQSSSFVIAIWTQFVLSRSCRRISTPVLRTMCSSLLILPASRPSRRRHYAAKIIPTTSLLLKNLKKGLSRTLEVKCFFS